MRKKVYPKCLFIDYILLLNNYSILLNIIVIEHSYFSVETVDDFFLYILSEMAERW